MTEGEGKDVLPGHGDVRPERAEIERNGGIPNVEPDPTARGRVKEPRGGPELGRQTRGQQAVQQDIAEERKKEKRLTRVEGVDMEGMLKVRTLEPLAMGQGCDRKSSPSRPSLRISGHSTGAG